MTIPDYQSLMLPVLRAAEAQETSVRACIERLADQFSLDDEERSRLVPSGGETIFRNRVHWAKTYLGKAGLIEITRRGHFRATPRGRALLATSPIRVDNSVLNQYAEFREFRAIRRSKSGESEPVQVPESELDSATPEERIDAAYDEITRDLLNVLIERLRGNTPTFFERAVLDLLVKMGYGGSRAEAAQRVGRTGDGGIDGVINEDRLGLDVVYVQAKRYGAESRVGSDKIREFAGALDDKRATKGVFITTGFFTDGARQTAERSPKRLILIDADELGRLLVEYGIGVRTERALEIKRLDLDFFSEDENE